MTFPFPMVCPRAALSLWDRTQGTNIGDMTSNGGLAASFDGNADQGFGAVSYHPGTAGYVGKTFGSPHPLHHMVLHSTNNIGWYTGSSSVTLKIFGKSGAAPAAYTDGTELGTLTFTESGTGHDSKTLNSNDINTAWDHVWAVSITGNNGPSFAEVEIYIMA